MLTRMYLLSALSVLLSLQAVQAQESGFQIGFKGGVSMFSPAGKNADQGPIANAFTEEVGLVGGMGALSLGFNIGQVLTIQPELAFVQKGYRYNSEFNENDYFQERLNYLEVPILVNVNIPIGESRIFAEAGPSIGYLVSGKRKLESETFSLGSEDEIDLDNYNRTDFSAVLGAGVGISNGNGGEFLVGIRYMEGLTKTENDDKTDFEATNRGGFIYLGYVVKL